MSTETKPGAELKKRVKGVVETLRDQFTLLRCDRLALAGALIVAVFVFLGLLGPALAPHDSIRHIVCDDAGLMLRLSEPIGTAPFGATAYGKDVLSQLFVGAQSTFTVGLFGGVGTGVLGFLVGFVSGYYGGQVDEVLIRLTDLMLSLSFTPIVLLLLTFVTPSVRLMTGIIVAFLRKMPAHVVRFEVPSVGEYTFVKLACASGASDLWTMLYHVVPNVFPIGFLYTAYDIAWAIAAQASLAFLGFGDPAVTSWGRMPRQVFESGSMRVAWWWVLPSALGITVITTPVFLIGRAYEEVINPEIQTEQ